MSLAASRVWRIGWFPRVATIALLIGTASESLVRYPDFIAFFNFAAGGPQGGLFKLSDSNLDWGQDLPLLIAWRNAHRDKPLYAAYFCMNNPADYESDWTLLQIASNRQPWEIEPSQVHGPAYVAISASVLQGPYQNEALRAQYGAYRALKPIAVLGGTIYVFDVPGG